MARESHKWQGRQILDEKHAQDLEKDAASLEFRDKLSRGEAEHRAYKAYRKDHHERSAAFHLRGMRAAQGAGDRDAAHKHGAMYQIHMEKLGHEPWAKVPAEIEKHVAAEDKEPAHKFRAHRGDALVLESTKKSEITESLMRIYAKAVDTLAKTMHGQEFRPGYSAGKEQMPSRPEHAVLHDQLQEQGFKPETAPKIVATPLGNLPIGVQNRARAAHQRNYFTLLDNDLGGTTVPAEPADWTKIGYTPTASHLDHAFWTSLGRAVGINKSELNKAFPHDPSKPIQTPDVYRSVAQTPESMKEHHRQKQFATASYMQPGQSAAPPATPVSAMHDAIASANTFRPGKKGTRKEMADVSPEHGPLYDALQEQGFKPEKAPIMERPQYPLFNEDTTGAVQMALDYNRNAQPRSDHPVHNWANSPAPWGPNAWGGNATRSKLAQRMDHEFWDSLGRAVGIKPPFNKSEKRYYKLEGDAVIETSAGGHSLGKGPVNKAEFPAPAHAPVMHNTVEGFMGGLKSLPKVGPERGRFITAHMNHAPFLQALKTHPQGPQVHQMLTNHLNSASNAGFRPGATVAVAKSEAGAPAFAAGQRASNGDAMVSIMTVHPATRPDEGHLYTVLGDDGETRHVWEDSLSPPKERK